jgi:hypothetical protein
MEIPFCATELVFIIFFPFAIIYYCCARSAVRHLQRLLQYIIVEFTLSIILLYFPSPDFWNSFSMSHFSIRNTS